MKDHRSSSLISVFYHHQSQLVDRQEVEALRSCVFLLHPDRDQNQASHQWSQLATLRGSLLVSMLLVNIVQVLLTEDDGPHSAAILNLSV